MRRAPQHRPIALALVAILLVDTVRGVLAGALPARADLALALSVPALSAWAALRAFRVLAWPGPVVGSVFAVAAAGALWAPAPDLWWVRAYPVAHGIATVAQVGAAALYMTRATGSTITQRVALVLAAGDVAGLLLGTVARTGEAWRVTALQGGAIALLVVGLQLGWIRGQARLEAEIRSGE